MDNWRSLVISGDTPILHAVEVIDKTKMQIALVVAEEGRLIGTVTDGDVRRAILHGVGLSEPVTRIMCARPTTASVGDSPETIRAKMHRKLLRHIPIVDGEGRIAGLYTLLQFMQLEEQKHDNLVVLMAGGRGERLRPLTLECPKPMLAVGTKPILQTILESFLLQGFSRFVISINYLGEVIENRFGDGSEWGAEITYLREETPLGTAGALSLLPERPDAPFLVMNADLLTKANFVNLLGFHAEHEATASMGVRSYEMQVPFGVAHVDNHRLVRLEEKPRLVHFVNAGIYALSPEALDFIPSAEPLDMPDLLNRMVAAGKEVAVYPVREYWMDIGRLSDYERANDEYALHFVC